MAAIRYNVQSRSPEWRRYAEFETFAGNHQMTAVGQWTVASGSSRPGLAEVKLSAVGSRALTGCL